MTEQNAVSAAAPAKIRPAQPADAEPVAQLLHREFAASVDLAAYRRLFEFTWTEGRHSPGLVVEAGGQVVGYLGTLYSDRTDASGKRYTVCSLSSWYVQPAFRTLGLALLLKTINQPGVSVISLSPNQNAAPVYVKCGMREISSGFELYPLWSAVNGTLLRRSPKIATDPSRVRARLPAYEQRILDDHAPYACRHYLIADASGVGYAVTKRRVRASFPRLPISEVLYFSDGDVVRRHFSSLIRRICMTERCIGVAFDRALLGADVPAGGVHRARLRVGRGADLQLAARDSLYSEMVLLDG